MQVVDKVVQKSKNKKFVKVGSLWATKDKNGNAFLSGSLEYESLDVSDKEDKEGNQKAVVYLSIHKNNKTKPNQPDYAVYQLREDNEEFIELDESSLNIEDDSEINF